MYHYPWHHCTYEEMRRFQLKNARTNYDRQRVTRTDDYAPKLPRFDFMHIFNLARKRSAKRFVWMDVNGLLNVMAQMRGEITKLVTMLCWFGDYLEYGLMSFQEKR